jgi:hypothetical protein
VEAIGRARLALAAIAAIVLPAIAPSAGAGTTNGGDCAPPPQYLGADAYEHVDELSYLDIASRAASATTADPAGTNDDNTHVISTQAGGAELMDVAGPGVVTMLRMQEDLGGPWSLSADGSFPSTPSAADFGLESVNASYPYPLALDPGQSEGSSVIATPSAFSSSFEVSSSGPNGNFYALYRKLPLGGSPPVMRAANRDVAQLLRSTSASMPTPGLTSVTGTALVPPGDTTLAELDGGPRQVREIRFTVPRDQAVAFANQRLRIYWDGETTPSVDAPVKFLVGAGGGVYEPVGRPLVRSFFTSATTNDAGDWVFSIQWPMPFRARARVAISSQASTVISGVRWSITTEPFRSPEQWWALFHATYSAVDAPVPGQDLTFLDVSGSGRIVGTVVNFGQVGAALEGDPHFYLDGSNTPQVTATGTEEWGLGGNYWHNGNQTSLPLGGLPTSDNNPPGTDTDGAALYRYLVADSMPFNSHATVRWEHGGTDDVSQPYRAVVLWYGTPESTAWTTDRFTAGDAASAAAHDLHAPSSVTTPVAAGYEYGVTEPVVTAMGLRTSGPLEFTVHVDPANRGVLLRRQLDTSVPDQAARVYVDGHYAGVWSNPGSFAGVGPDGTPRRFLDDEVLLASRLTAGKQSITIRLVPLTTRSGTRAWTMFDVTVMSMVPRCGPTAS